MNDIELPENLDAANERVEQLLDVESTEALNALVLHPGHTQHQAVIKALQGLADPSSVAVLRQALSDGFGIYAYTCSEDDVIAKWFSWALFAIGTPESIEVLREFASHENAAIAEEMRYRLAKTSSHP